MCTVRRLMQNARFHSSVFIRSIQVQVCECAFALHQEKKRDHFGTVAIDVHRMLHHDSIAPTTRATGLGWTSGGQPHIQGVHRNLRANPVDPSSPLQKLSQNTDTYCFMHNEYPQVSDFVPFYAGITVSVRRTRLSVLVLWTLALLAGE